MPRIQKAIYIRGKRLVFREACVKDAEFILSLRTDEKKGKHLSQTPPDIERQIAWLKEYAKHDDEAYFIIEILGEPIGTVRLYDAIENSFCWGSWILKEGAPAFAAIESALMVYVYALDYLGFENAHFDVRKTNEKVWKFHERFGAERTSETTEDYFYRIDMKSIRSSIRRYRKYLTEGVRTL